VVKLHITEKITLKEYCTTAQKRGKGSPDNHN